MANSLAHAQCSEPFLSDYHGIGYLSTSSYTEVGKKNGAFSVMHFHLGRKTILAIPVDFT